MPSNKRKITATLKLAATPSPSSSHTMSPASEITSSAASSSTVPSTATEWVKKRGLFYPFSAPSHTVDGTEQPRSALEFEIKGAVVSAFLKANALSHSLTLRVEQKDIENLRLQVKDGPSHDQSDFRWPVEETVIKLVSKVDLDMDFTPIWDEDGGEERTPDDVEEGSSVMVKFTPIFYLGRKAKGSDAGFAPGLTLRLNAVYIMTKGQAFANLTFESPSKRQKVRESQFGI